MERYFSQHRHIDIIIMNRGTINVIDKIIITLGASTIFFLGVARIFVPLLQGERHIPFLLAGFASFSLPMIIIAASIIYLSGKFRPSSGYLVISGIMCAFSVRHFSVMIYCAILGSCYIVDSLTFILPGIVFFLTAILFLYVAFRKKRGGE